MNGVTEKRGGGKKKKEKTIRMHNLVPAETVNLCAYISEVNEQTEKEK